MNHRYSGFFHFCHRAWLLLALVVAPLCAAGQTAEIRTQRGTATVLIAPYAPNIVRVSISLSKNDALAAPGYGISAAPDATGWVRRSGPKGDTLESSDLVVSLAPQPAPYGGPLPETAKFFSGSTGFVGLDRKSVV